MSPVQDRAPVVVSPTWRGTPTPKAAGLRHIYCHTQLGTPPTQEDTGKLSNQTYSSNILVEFLDAGFKGVASFKYKRWATAGLPTDLPCCEEV